MVELSNERIEQMLHEEIENDVDRDEVLRSIYSRYIQLYERYFADVDALDDDAVAALREYHEETRSLIKLYYMDIPQDTCTQLKEFDEQYIEKLLGPGWHEYLFGGKRDIKKKAGTITKVRNIIKRGMRKKPKKS